MDEDFIRENTQWLEKEVGSSGLRLWHVLGMVFFSILAVGKKDLKYNQFAKLFIATHFFTVVLLCCCFRFRIPRTKQEIEADYNRRKIVKKFRKRIQKFENSEMDAEMDLKKALEKIRADFMKETQKSSDHSSASDNDESNYDDKKSGARKKKLQSCHNKKDQLIQTIYTGNCYDEVNTSVEPKDN